MRAAFIPALPPSALLAGMIAPSFRLVNRFPEKSWFARAAAVSGRPRCALYFLGIRSLAGGSHPHPPLAVAWAVFAANGGGASVSSAHLAQETRHVPPPRSLRRSNRPHQPSEVWRAAALQVKSYRPAPPGGRGVCAPRRKHSLHVSPAAPKAQGKRAPPPAEKIANGELFRRPPSGGAFPTPL